MAELTKQQINFATGDLSPIQVKISQFFGIEINDFAVAVAKTALWIAEAQMWNETQKIVQNLDDFLPLENYENIIEANALKIDWATVVKPDELNFIMGNPPFIGRRYRTEEQHKEVAKFFDYKGHFRKLNLYKMDKIKNAANQAEYIFKFADFVPETS